MRAQWIGAWCSEQMASPLLVHQWSNNPHFCRGSNNPRPVLTSQGMIALEIFEGSVNKECFIRFLQDNIVHSFFVCARYDTN
jgi:hypothetical protein